MRRPHSGLKLHGLRTQALSRPWRGPGRCWVHLAFSSFFTGNCTWVHQIKPAATSSVTDGPEGTENYRHVTVQHFGTSEGQSEAEASTLPEWVQIAMAKLIGMIRDQESRVTTFCFTLYCADTGQNTEHKTFKRVFFISHIIMRRKWANNIKKKSTIHKNTTTILWLFLLVG